MPNKILRNDSNLSIADHRQIAQHLCAIKGHTGAIMDILNGKIRAPFLDTLIRFYNGMPPLSRLRWNLEDDLFGEHRTNAPPRSFYSGFDPARQLPCTLNSEWDSQEGSCETGKKES